RADALVPTDPLEPAGPGLELSHAHRVLVRHPHRQVPRHESRKLEIPALNKRPQPPEILLRIRPVLVIDETPESFTHNRPKPLGEASRRPLDVGAGDCGRVPGRPRGGVRGEWGSDATRPLPGACRGPCRHRQPGFEPTEGGFDLNALGLDSLAMRILTERQDARPRPAVALDGL